MTLRHGQAVALMVVVTLLWATAGVVTRQIEQAQAFEITFWRSAFTALSLAVILPAWQGWGVWRRIASGGRTLWVSGVCWAVMFTAFMVALALTSVANVLITLAAGPLLTALVSRLFFGQRLARSTWGAIGVAGAGIAWMFARQLGEGGWLGSLVALGAPLGGAFNWNLVQRSQRLGRGVDLVPAVFIGALLSATLTLPLAWPGVAAGALLALTLSLDDFVVTFFTAGPGATTLPLYIYSSVKLGVSPKVHALSTLIVGLSAFFLALGYALSRRRV
jgi:drug/metabolite transporter (DMT)-like permease